MSTQHIPGMGEGAVSLLFTGDVMLGRLVNEYLKRQRNKSIVWGNTLPILKNSDLTFINLECAITRETSPGKKDTPVFFFRSDPENIQALTKADVDFCCLANNHVLDFGERGLLQTLEFLKRAGIYYSGAGENLDEAQSPAEISIKNLKIKVFSFTDNEKGWRATRRKPGINYIPIDLRNRDAKLLFETVEKAKKEGYLVVVSTHWGPNMLRFPLDSHIEFAHKLIDSGCDIIHGHSSHVFQPVEIYKKKVIFYDCGEMLDDYAVDPLLRNDESFIFEVYLKNKAVTKVVLTPIIIDNLQVNLAKGNLSVSICQKMINLCNSFETEAVVKDGKVIIPVSDL